MLYLNFFSFLLSNALWARNSECPKMNVMLRHVNKTRLVLGATVFPLKRGRGTVAYR